MTTSTAEHRKGKWIFILSVITFIYFTTLILLYKFEYDAVIIGVFREILTLPFVAMVPVLLVLAIISFRKVNYKTGSLSFYSIVILFLTMVMMIAFS